MTWRVERSSSIAVFVFVLAVVVFSGVTVHVGRAQDSVILHDKSVVRGEILVDNDEEVRILDRTAEVVVIGKDRVRRIRRGRGLKKVVERRLAAIDVKNADALFGVAHWADEKKHRRDAGILARRVLYLDRDHEGARVYLGHVKAIGRWFPDRKTADRAVAEKMTAAGYVAVSGGWIKASDRGAYAASPDDFMLVELLWRRVVDVMAERGFVAHKGLWYKKEEIAALKSTIEDLEATYRDPIGAAQVGGCQVYGVVTRDEAIEIAGELDKARRWFTETFAVEDEPLAERPISQAFVLTDQGALETFCRKWRSRFRLGSDEIKLSLKLKNVTLPKFGKAIHKRYGPWRNNLVGTMGAELIRYRWHDRFLIPAAVWVANAHLAETHVFGSSRTQWIQGKSEYARGGDTEPKITGRTIGNAKASLKSIFDAGEAPSMAEVFAVQAAVELTKEQELYAVVLTQYFLEHHRRGWIGYIREGKSSDKRKHFLAHFGVPYEKMERDFREWVRR